MPTPYTSPGGSVQVSSPVPAVMLKLTSAPDDEV
jgi:hypothetical protein